MYSSESSATAGCGRASSAHMAVASFLVADPTSELNSTETKISLTSDQGRDDEQAANSIATDLAKFL